jgi:uncharacterized protein YidB (DUF937 family)
MVFSSLFVLAPQLARVPLAAQAAPEQRPGTAPFPPRCVLHGKGANAMTDTLSRILARTDRGEAPHMTAEGRSSGNLDGGGLTGLVDGLSGYPGGLDLREAEAGAAEAAGADGLNLVVLRALLASLTQGRGGSRGLATLTDRLREAGLGPQVDSWIAQGGNQPADPVMLERALPRGALAEVETRTGLARQDVLNRLSHGLPRMVDRLTPDGRLPGRDEDLPEAEEDEVLSGFGISRAG